MSSAGWLGDSREAEMFMVNGLSEVLYGNGRLDTPSVLFLLQSSREQGFP